MTLPCDMKITDWCRAIPIQPRIVNIMHFPDVIIWYYSSSSGLLSINICSLPEIIVIDPNPGVPGLLYSAGKVQGAVQTAIAFSSIIGTLRPQKLYYPMG